MVLILTRAENEQVSVKEKVIYKDVTETKSILRAREFRGENNAFAEMFLLSLLVFGCFPGSRKVTSLKTTGATSSHGYEGRGCQGAWAGRVVSHILFPVRKRIILLELRSFIILPLKRGVDLF